MKNKTIKAKIIGTGSYLPKKILSNEDLEKIVETTDEWIITRTGIKERRIAQKDEFASDMGYVSAKRAIEDADISADDIDCIIVATLSPDYFFPSTSCIIQDKLKIRECAAFDMQAACSGFVYGITIAKSFIESGQYKNILVIATEKLSSFVNYEDRATCVLFGDAAGAVVVSANGTGLSIEGSILGADGKYSGLLSLPAGGSRLPASHDTVDKKLHYIHMKGNEVFKQAVRRMHQASMECLKKVNLNENDIDWLIPHQANIRIIEALAKRFPHLSEEKVFKDVVYKCGNTSASTIAISLDELKKKKAFKSKDKILLTAFGSGLTWAASVLIND